MLVVKWWNGGKKNCLEFVSFSFAIFAPTCYAAPRRGLGNFSFSILLCKLQWNTSSLSLIWKLICLPGSWVPLVFKKKTTWRWADDDAVDGVVASTSVFILYLSVYLRLSHTIQALGIKVLGPIFFATEKVVSGLLTKRLCKLVQWSENLCLVSDNTCTLT